MSEALSWKSGLKKTKQTDTVPTLMELTVYWGEGEGDVPTDKHNSHPISSLLSPHYLA